MLTVIIATLIGVFVTPDHIVVGADTAISNGDGTFQSAPRKYCQTGPVSVSAIQGTYAIGSNRVTLFNHWGRICDRFVKGAPLMINAQAETMAEELRKDVAQFASEVSPEEFAREVIDPHIVFIIVAGYEGGRPVVAVQEVRAEKTGSGKPNIFRTRIEPTVQCRGWFIGNNAVIAALRTPPGPPVNRSRPEIARLIQPLSECKDSSYEAIKSSFAMAVELTREWGGSYKIPKDAVGPPLDIVLITNSKLTIERIPGTGGR
jgi:hypothetical protein